MYCRSLPYIYIYINIRCSSSVLIVSFNYNVAFKITNRLKVNNNFKFNGNFKKTLKEHLIFIVYIYIYIFITIGHQKRRKRKENIYERERERGWCTYWPGVASSDEEKKKKRRKGVNLEWNLHCNLREQIGNSHIIRCKKLFGATRCSNKQMS